MAVIEREIGTGISVRREREHLNLKILLEIVKMERRDFPVSKDGFLGHQREYSLLGLMRCK